eukprot:ctg_1834.g472
MSVVGNSGGNDPEWPRQLPSKWSNLSSTDPLNSLQHALQHLIGGQLGAAAPGERPAGAVHAFSAEVNVDAVCRAAVESLARLRRVGERCRAARRTAAPADRPSPLRSEYLSKYRQWQDTQAILQECARRLWSADRLSSEQQRCRQNLRALAARLPGLEYFEDHSADHETITLSSRTVLVDVDVETRQATVRYTSDDGAEHPDPYAERDLRALLAAGDYRTLGARLQTLLELERLGATLSNVGAEHLRGELVRLNDALGARVPAAEEVPWTEAVEPWPITYSRATDGVRLHYDATPELRWDHEVQRELTMGMRSHPGWRHVAVRVEDAWPDAEHRFVLCLPTPLPTYRALWRSVLGDEKATDGEVSIAALLRLCAWSQRHPPHGRIDAANASHARPRHSIADGGIVCHHDPQGMEAVATGAATEMRDALRELSFRTDVSTTPSVLLVQRIPFISADAALRAVERVRQQHLYNDLLESMFSARTMPTEAGVVLGDHRGAVAAHDTRTLLWEVQVSSAVHDDVLVLNLAWDAGATPLQAPSRRTSTVPTADTIHILVHRDGCIRAQRNGRDHPVLTQLLQLSRDVPESLVMLYAPQPA